MDILFIISVFGHGSGGHFHSLDHISNELSKHNKINIISIGTGNSKVIFSNKNFFKHIYFNGLNYLELRKKILDIVDKKTPEVIHFFDFPSYNIIKLFLAGTGCKIFVSKCGGPIIKFFPYVPNLVLFSKEDLNWFDSKRKYKKTNIFLIPNRVKIVDIPSAKNSGDEFVFMRICRIGTKYYDGIIKSIQLIFDLAKTNKNPVKLIIIGRVEDENIYQDLLSKSINLPITFHISEDFTDEASKFLNLGDAIIGTGRGAIEASSMGKPVLVFEQRLNIPVLITSKEIWNQSLYYNFSERTQLNFISREKNIQNIIKTIVDFKFRHDISQQTLNFFKEDLSILDLNNKYISAYSASNTFNLTFRNFDFYSFLKSWSSFVKRT